MLPKLALPALKRPRGLAARAVVFSTCLILTTAAMSAATLLIGAHRESGRSQIEIASELSGHFATATANAIRSGDTASLGAVVEQLANRDQVRRISIRDESGRTLAESGRVDVDARVADELAARVLASRRLAYRRTSAALALASPIVVAGQQRGVAVIIWNAGAYRLNAAPALAPFLLILACLALAAVPITARLVRRAVSPLDELARHAEEITVKGRISAPIEIRTGDEFETLANALTGMMRRLDTSMRRIQEIAFLDPATQLPNQDWISREIELSLAQRGQGGAIVILDLRRAAKVRQSLDAGAAGEFLASIVARLSEAVGAVDRALNSGRTPVRIIAARLGGDEYAVFMPSVSSADEAVRFAQYLIAVLNRPLEWRGHQLELGASAGIALAPGDAADPSALIRRARLALPGADARPGARAFTAALDRELSARFSLEREMRGALERNEFRAYFQPKVNLDTGAIEACEALARWVRPDRTIVGPARFIPVAEESGLIGRLSDAILREACWKAAAWARAGSPVKVAVNVSALQFRDERFAQNVLRVLEHAGLPPDRLELEITESVAMEDPARATRLITPLRAAGIRLAIDDFGCGHSSLAALSRLPFDVIKIDQQFIRALGQGDEQAAAIVDMILALARALRLEVVAEGVERREDAEFVASRGCRWVQGFLYGAAVSATDFAEMLRRQTQATGVAA